MHLPVDHRRQAGVREHGDRQAAVVGEVADVLAHLGGAGRAVDAEDVGAHGVDGGEGGADLGAEQHAAGQLDRDLHLQRHLAALGRHGPPGADDRRLRRQQVELGLDEEQVDAAVEQAAALRLRSRRAARRRGSARATATSCPGPTEPATNRRRSGVVNASATSRAMRALASLSSSARSAIPYSARVPGRAPKVFVSTTSHPASK